MKIEVAPQPTEREIYDDSKFTKEVRDKQFKLLHKILNNKNENTKMTKIYLETDKLNYRKLIHHIFKIYDIVNQEFPFENGGMIGIDMGDIKISKDNKEIRINPVLNKLICKHKPFFKTSNQVSEDTKEVEINSKIKLGLKKDIDFDSSDMYIEISDVYGGEDVGNMLEVIFSLWNYEGCDMQFEVELHDEGEVKRYLINSIGAIVGFGIREL